MLHHRLNDRSELGVNTRDGDAIVQASDVHLSGVGLDTSLDRTYNSLDTASGQFGTGWRMSMGSDVRLVQDNNSNNRLDYVAPGGQRYGTLVRHSSSSNSFYTPSFGGLDADLKDNGDGTYEMKFHASQLKYTFKTPTGCADPSTCDKLLTKQVDRNGNEIDYNYNCATQQLTSIKDTQGRYLHVVHDPTTGLITSIVEAAPTSTPSSCTEASGWTTPAWTSSPRTWAYHYNSTNQLDYYLDPTGARTDYAYSGGLLTKVTDPAQANGNRPTTTLSYGSGQVDGATVSTPQVTALDYAVDTAGDTDHFTYSYNVSNSATDSNCNTTGWDYYTAVTDSTDLTGGITFYCFQNRQAPPKPDYPAGPNGSYPAQLNASNNTDGNVPKLRVVDGVGHRRSSSFDPDQGVGQDTSQQNEGVSGGSTSYTYNVNNDIQQAADPKDSTSSTAGTTSFDYGTDSGSVAGGTYLPSSAATSDGNCVGQAYDSSGNLTDSYDGLAASSSKCGTSGGRHSHVHRHDNGTPDYAYGPVVADLNQPDSAQPTVDDTRYSYYGSGDPSWKNGELKQVVRPGGNAACTTGNRAGCTSYDYDGDSRVTSTTDGNGNTTSFSYDQDDRPTAVLTGGATSCGSTDIAAGNCVKYTYDAEGNLNERDDRNGATTFTFDLLNRPLTQRQPNGTSLTSVYDAAGNLHTYTQTVGAASDTVTYTYDAANDLRKVSDSAIGSNPFVYDPDSQGRTKTLQLPTSPAVTYTYTYSNGGKLTGISPGGATGLSRYVYSYGSGSQDTDKLQSTTVTPMNSDGTTGGSGVTTNYDYDGHDDRFQDTKVNGTTTFKVNYDDDSNVRSIVDGSNTTYYGYNENDELCWSGPTDGATSPSGGVCPATPINPPGDVTYNHDGAGENLGTTAAPIHYDPQQQVDQLTNPNGTGGAVTQTYLDQGNNLRLTSGADAITTGGPVGDTARTRGTLTTFYVRDPYGQMLASYDVNNVTGSPAGASSQVFYYLDRQGSTVALLNQTAAATATYTYTPLGRTTISNIGSSTTGTANPWRNIGGYQDPTDGYYHFGARYYDTAGHFTQPDSIAGAINRPEKYNSYTYTAGDPVNGTDLSGKDFLGISLNINVGFAHFSIGADIGSGGFHATVGAGLGPKADSPVSVGASVNPGSAKSGGSVSAQGCVAGACESEDLVKGGSPTPSYDLTGGTSASVDAQYTF